MLEVRGPRDVTPKACHDPGEDHHEPVRPGVHDAGLAEDLQLFGSSLDGRLPIPHRAL